MFKFKKNYAVFAAIAICSFGLLLIFNLHAEAITTTETNPIIQCADSDGGKDYNKMGVVSGYDVYGGNTNSIKSYTDKCDGTNRVMEFYCATQNDPHSGAGYVAMENSPCKNGYVCKDGACAAATTAKHDCGSGQIIGDINNDGKITKDDSEIVGKMDIGTFSAPADICCADADLDGKLTTFDALRIDEITAGTKISLGKCGESVITMGSSTKFIKGNTYTIAFKTTNANLDSKLTYQLYGPDGKLLKNEYFNKSNTASNNFYLDRNDTLTFLMSFYPASSWTAGEYKVIFEVETNNVKLKANEIKLEVLNPLPDLAIEDIYSDNGKLSVKIKNIGATEVPANKGHLYIYIDDKLTWTYSLSTLSDQKFRSVGGISVIQPQILTGSHIIKATIDPKAEISELNENNNTLTKTAVFAAPSSDFIVSDLKIEQQSGDSGKYIYATVENIGERVLPAIYSILDIKIEDLDTGEVSKAVFSGDYVKGYKKEVKSSAAIKSKSTNSYRLKATVDSVNYLQEANETNNTLAKTITVNTAMIGKPDLIITDLKYYANGITEPKIGDPVGYEVTIKNIGTADAKGPFFVVSFYLRDILVAPNPSRSFDSSFILPPGQSFVDKVSDITKFGNLGENKMTVNIHFVPEAYELNENNNTFTKVITVSNSIIKCSDSDGGKDYNKKGEALRTVDGQTSNNAIDKCLNQNTLNEVYCSNGDALLQTIYFCPNGCKDGACIQADTLKPDLIITDVQIKTTPPIEIEGKKKTAVSFILKYKNIGNTDISAPFYVSMESSPTADYPAGFKGGRYVDVANSPIKTNTEYTTVVADYLLTYGTSLLDTNFTFYIDRFFPFGDANDNVIKESNENNNTFTKTINLRSTDSGACSDSDGGQNYFSKGEASKTVNGYTTGAFDICLDANTLYEAYCSNVNVMNETYKCPNGCKDGACIAATAKPDLIITGVEKKLTNQTIGGIVYDVIDFTIKYKLNASADLNKNFYFGVETDPTNEYINGFKVNSNINYINSSSLTKANQEYSVFLSAGYLLKKGNSLKTTFKITIDNDPFSISNSNLIDESNENNNTFTKTINIKAAESLPDLAIDDIYSDNGKLSVKIKNSGTAEVPANKGHLYIYIDNKLGWTYSLFTLSDQKFRSVNGSSIVQPQILTGSHIIKAVIDPKSEISELNEDNNTLTKTVAFNETAKPDLVFKTDSFKYYVKDGIPRVYIEVEDVNKVYDLKNGLALTASSGGKSNIFAGSVSDYTIGYELYLNLLDIKIDNKEHTIKFTADPHNLADESNENNNTFTKTINIGATDICPTEYFPVCGKDNKTYSNECEAKKAGAVVDYNLFFGKCKESILKPDWAVESISLSPKPDLKLEDITISPSSPAVNQKVTVVVKGINAGNADLTSAKGILNFYRGFNNFVSTSDNIPLRQTPVSDNPLAPGTNFYYDFTGYFTKEGKASLSFVTDNANELEELNESNNAFAKIINIGETATGVDNKVESYRITDTMPITVKPGDILRLLGNFPEKYPDSQDGYDRHTAIAFDDYYVIGETDFIKHDVKWSKNEISVRVPKLPDGNVVIKIKIWDKSYYELTYPSLRILSNDINSSLESIKNAAKNLNENKFDQILAEIKTLKDVIKEQEAQIKYLSKLTQGVQKLSEKVENAINNFITYGVDDNTKRLGAGERAAVMYSYKAAFDKLPETDEELSDAIKIANGRWPSITNPNAENKAKEHFKKIYKRTPDMNNARDNAAVTIMAYGLRPRAENRNLDSERAGIAIFKGIYKKLPETTEEWDITRAITYSGATR